jgi:hypothetical protein
MVDVGLIHPSTQTWLGTQSSLAICGVSFLRQWTDEGGQLIRDANLTGAAAGECGAGVPEPLGVGTHGHSELADGADAAFADELLERGVHPVAAGRRRVGTATSSRCPSSGWGRNATLRRRGIRGSTHGALAGCARRLV